jgi:aminoglycoside phosphotransferase (APT) family kinase protein
VCARKMHEDQVDIDDDLVRRLLKNQFPQWADLPLEYFDSGGTVNAIYRLGPQMYVRLPLQENWVWHLKTEMKWLPRLQPHVPYPIPEALGYGEPDLGYPFPWGIYSWIDGEPWAIERLRDLDEGARDLAKFVKALWAIDTTDGKIPRGVMAMRLRAQDQWVRSTAELARDMIDADALLAAWDDALELPDFAGPGRWTHSDICQNGNVLIKDGRMHAVIDWGSVHVGDTAKDVATAWSLLTGPSRQIFRAELGVDDETWLRARGWAMRSVGALDYYRHTNPAMVAGGLHTINEVLTDLRRDV